MTHHRTAPRPRRDHRGRGQGGQLVPVLAVVLVLAGVLALGVVHLGAAAARQASAQAAADAAALAGAAEDRDAAEAVALANDARLTDHHRDGADVVVTVERHGHRAHARARWVPFDPSGEAAGGSPDHPGAHP